MTDELNPKFWSRLEETIESIDVKLAELNKEIGRLRWTEYRLEKRRMELKLKFRGRETKR